MNSSLAIWGPFLAIFGGALLVSVVQRYARDICLLNFDDDHVLVRMKDGKWLWGKLQVHSKALEMVYAHPVLKPAGHGILSRIFYEQNIADIGFILRPEPAPGSAAYDKWAREMQRLRNPPLLRRLGRGMRNIFNMLRNAFSESVALIVGVVKQRTAVGKVAGMDRHATDAGQKLLAAIPASYEPILEHYLSREVAVETFKDPANPGAGVLERVGVLAEYSDKFLYLRDVQLTEAIPEAALRTHDARDRFAVILPRSTSFVRHLAVRPDPSAAVVAMTDQPGSSSPITKPTPEENLVRS